MRYNSIGEYFYRLSNRCLVLALIPVILVWIAYLINQYFLSGLPWLQPGQKILLIAIGGVGIIIILIFWVQAGVVKSKLKKILTEPSLGVKIKQYIPIVLIRFRSFSFMLLMIGLSVFLTAELLFLYLLLVPLLLFMTYWPVRWRVSKDLRLKHEEKEILKNKALGV